jgi:hypothetical protein
MGLLSGFDNYTGWTLLQKNSAAIEKAYASSSTSSSDIAYFESVAPSIKTPAELMQNYRALTFVATAYGLGSEVNQTAILNKLMTQDPTSTSSLAQQLSDNRYRNFATAMSAWTSTSTPFTSTTSMNTIIAGYQENSFETSIGTDSTVLQEAQYFSKNAQGLTLLSQVMSDPALLDVVTTSLGIPTAFKSLDYDQQVAILKPRVDMSQFATATGVSNMINKYLVMDQLNNGSSTSSSSPILSLFSSSSSSNSQSGVTTPTPLSVTASMLNILL